MTQLETIQLRIKGINLDLDGMKEQYVEQLGEEYADIAMMCNQEVWEMNDDLCFLKWFAKQIEKAAPGVELEETSARAMYMTEMF